MVEQIEVVTDVANGRKTDAFQLKDVKEREKRLQLLLGRGAEKTLPAIKADWKKLLISAINAGGGKFDSKSARHAKPSRNKPKLFSN